MDPLAYGSLTCENKRESLRSLILLKEKQDWSIKCIACADGSWKIKKIKKEDTTPPTIELESLLFNPVIDAYNVRDVAVCDIPGAHLNVNMDEEVIIILEGCLEQLISMVVPDIYQQHTHVKKRKITVREAKKISLQIS